MKDDLISQKAAIDALNINGCCGMGIQYIVDCDSVPAVPLELLCNFLAAYAAPPIRSPLAIYGSLEEAWKAFLIEWMEEQQS